MDTFVGYCSQFAENDATKQTHLAFKGGKYNVPDDKYEEFYATYFKHLIGGDNNLFMIEKIHNSLFQMFMDIEAPKGSDIVLDDDIVKSILKATDEGIKKVLKEPKIEYIVSKSTNEKEQKYHVNFPGIIVDSRIVKQIFNNTKNEEDNGLMKCVDMSVYRTGLRMLGSKKKVADHVYRIYDLERGEFDKSQLTWETFCKTIIRVTRAMPKTPVMNVTEGEETAQDLILKGVDGLTPEVKMLLEDLAKHNECLGGMNLTP
jgi:hypothetical protein